MEGKGLFYNHCWMDGWMGVREERVRPRVIVGWRSVDDERVGINKSVFIVVFCNVCDVS